MVDKEQMPSAEMTNVACTLMARDYKGVNNFGFNGVLKVAYDEQNSYFRGDVVGTIMTDGSSPKHNNGINNGWKNE